MMRIYIALLQNLEEVTWILNTKIKFGLDRISHL
jgi:hypothetical protein